MSMSTGAEIRVRLLLRIVLLFLFTSCTLPARLQWKSSTSTSPSPYDYMTIGQSSQSSDKTPSLYDYIPTGQPSSPSVSLFLTTNPPPPAAASSSCSCDSWSTDSGSASCSCSSSTSFNQSINLTDSGSSSTSFNQSINLTVGQPASPKNDNTSFGQPSHSPLPTAANITVPAGASRGGLNLLGKIGIAIAVIVVLLAIFIAVFKAFKKASQNDNGNDLGAGSIDIHSYRTAQLANPGGNSLEVDIIDIRTHTVEELNSLEVGIDIRTYTMDELKNATDNFTTKVGQGASGFVYRAKLPGNRLGAVKRATNLDTDLFKQELSVLLRLPHHPQLVDLIGLCLQADERILVFEFVSSGSLYDRLHKNKGLTSPLSWAARIDIAFQVAVALQYLHEEAKPPILHRDVKSANVLLEDDNRAKLADFGLSKLGPKDNQFTNTAVRGSIGYMDPQYMKTHRFSAKSDVYSFGVLLLELMTGFKSLHEDTPLAEWTQTYRFSEDIDIFMTIVDRNMMDHINTMEVQNMIKVANLCLRDLTEERSSMREIVNMMQETRNLKANGNLSDGGEAPLLGNGNLSDGAQCLHH